MKYYTQATFNKRVEPNNKEQQQTNASLNQDLHHQQGLNTKGLLPISVQSYYLNINMIISSKYYQKRSWSVWPISTDYLVFVLLYIIIQPLISLLIIVIWIFNIIFIVFVYNNKYSCIFIRALCNVSL